MSAYSRLSIRLKLLSSVWVLAIITFIALTLLVSSQLQGSSQTINKIGSLRLKTYHIMLQLQQQTPRTQIAQEVAFFDKVLAETHGVCDNAPLIAPKAFTDRLQCENLNLQWQQQIKPLFLASANNLPREADILPFVQQIDALINALGQRDEMALTWLRLIQIALIAMVTLSAILVTRKLYHWFITPLNHLQQGVADIAQGHYGIQIPVDASDEFSQVDKGFNEMSRQLQDNYLHLEETVAEKTRDLADKHYALSKLYGISRGLHQINNINEAAHYFLAQILQIVPAAAGSIRLTDDKRRRLDLVAEIGLPKQLHNAEQCQTFDECVCGSRIQQDFFVPINFVTGYEIAGKTVLMERAQIRQICAKSGFQQLLPFKVEYQQQRLGLLTLYFAQQNARLSSEKEELVNALCDQFAAIISNMRLTNESRQFAVLQERNLIAQGLHDSIAQVLTFMNLQLQMLESAIKAKNTPQVEENLQFLKEGVQECYEDVRELLLNFRTKVKAENFMEAVQHLLTRFETQTQIHAQVQYQGKGAPLKMEQELQFIFVLQESLSNIRKHAQASDVTIKIHNDADFVMEILDNGVGFDVKQTKQTSVGLKIMLERAARIQANLTISSQPGQTQVRLALPASQRQLL